MSSPPRSFGRGNRRMVSIILVGILTVGFGSWLKATLADASRQANDSAGKARGLTPDQKLQWAAWREEADAALALAQVFAQQLAMPNLLGPLWQEAGPVVSQAVVEVLAPGPARKPELGEKITPFILADPAGRPYRLADVLGKRPIVIELSSFS